MLRGRLHFGLIKKALMVGLGFAMMASLSAKELDQSDIAEQLDPYFQALADNNRVLGEVALYKGNKPLYAKTLEPKGNKTIITDNHYKYKIGSITKTFTAAIVLQLVEEGKLKLNTPLSTFYPKVANSKTITIHQMLSHHSGIHNYTADDDFLTYYQEPQSKAFLVNKIEGFESDFEPGEKGEYSNSNYLLLGYIIEELESKSYDQVLKDRIIKPLQLNDTLLGKAINVENKEAYSYRLQDNWEQVPEWDMSVASAAGALVSTANDLNTFVTSLFGGKLLSDKSLQTMIELEDGFGKGIFKTQYKHGEETVEGYWHNGGIEAFISHMAYYPKEDITVVVLTNGLNHDIRGIYESMLDAYFGQKVEVPEFGVAIELSKEQLEPLTGHYESDSHPLDIEVMVEGDQLYAQATGQGAFPLTPISENEFEFSKAGIAVTFDRESAQFVIKQGGRADIFERVGEQKVKAKVEVSMDVLKQYVGLYQSDDFPLDIDIMLKDSELYAQATGQQAFPLTAVSDTEFTFKLAGIKIEFMPEQKQLVITQHGKANTMTKK